MRTRDCLDWIGRVGATTSWRAGSAWDGAYCRCVVADVADVGGDVGAVDDLPIAIGEPGQAELFKLVFGDHVADRSVRASIRRWWM